MKKRFLKVVAIILAVVLAIPAYATEVKAAANWDNVSTTKYASRYQTSDYTTGKFYDNMTKIPLTGDGARDVVAVAASQMGYIEGDSAYGYDGETGGSTNYTEYGYYLGLTGGSSHAWCAAFCSWVFYTAEVTDVDGYYYRTTDGNVWADTYVPNWSNFLYDEGSYRFSDYYRYSYDSSQASYTPQPGDLIFFTAGYEPLDEGHIGLVAFSDGTYVYTLEGNTSSQDGVEAEGGGAFFKKYELSSSSIAGYGILPYETNDALPVIDYTGENPTTGLYVTTSGAKSVYLDIEDTTASWTLPMSSVFEVLEIDTDSLGNTMLYSKCEISGETVYGWILHGNTSNGATRTFQIYSSYEDPNDQNHDGIPDSYNHTVNADGSYSFENVYGHSFYINDVNGTIDGEDATLITSSTAYASANPNWAISVQLRPTGNDTEYEVVKVVECPQTSDAATAGITFEDGDVVMVVHSAASYPGYSNWKNKVAALTLEPGDIVNISADNKYVTVPSVENPEDPETPVDPDPETPVDPDPTPDPEPDTPKEEVIVSGNIHYANGYDWTNGANNIYAFASSDSTATPQSIIGQGDGFMQWWTGIVFEYNSTNDTWKVTEVYAPGTGAEDVTLGDNKFVVIFHDTAATAQPEDYNFFTQYAVVGAEFEMTTSLSALQSASGALSGVTLSSVPAEETPDDPGYVVLTDVVRYQTRGDKDVRFIAYVDELEKYVSVAFVLTIDGRVSQPLVCTTAYEGLLANGVTKTTQDIYKRDGYFVTYTILDYLSVYGGKEVTVTVTYTLTTGETFTDARTMIVGEAEVETPDEPVVIESASLTYANGYTWDDSTAYLNNIYVYASSDSSDTVEGINGQTLFGWAYGMVLEYNSTNGTWVVTSVDLTAGDGNTTESETLGANKMVVIFYEGATGSDFFKKYAVVGTELYLNGTLSRIQSTTGTLSGVSLANGKAETVLGDVPDYGGAIPGAGLQGTADNLYYGADLSFYNVSDWSYNSGATLDDSGADYSLVDFEAMKADGCDFVILRVGSYDSSGNYYDPHFVKLYNMAREAGLDIGLYFYSHALTYDGVVAEANFVINVIESYDMYFEYPLYIDIEEKDQLALGTTGLDSLCNAWCTTMIDAGYFPGIYGNYNLYDQLSSDIIANYDFWLAYVSTADEKSDYNPDNMNLSDECSMWQYSFYGYEYDGIGLDMLDVNVCYKDYPSIMKNGGYNNVP